MKKLIAAVVAAIALVSGAFAQRTIVLDMAESATTAKVEIKKNPYGNDYQNTEATRPTFTQQLKGGMPEVGDKVQVNYKFTSNANLERLQFALIDTSAAANYWLPLFEGDWPGVDNVEAGKVYSGVIEFDVTAEPKGAVAVVLSYNQSVNSVISFEKTGVATTKIVKAKRAPKTWTIDLRKNAALINFAPNYPWVNNVQDRSTLLGYRSEISITKAFGKDMPIVGDTVVLTYKGISSKDIAKVQVLLYDHSQAANWWLPLAGDEFATFAENIKAQTPFNAKVTYKVTTEPLEDVSLCFDYTLEDCSGSSIIKAAK